MRTFTVIVSCCLLGFLSYACSFKVPAQSIFYAPPTTTFENSDYIIGPSDELTIKVASDQMLSGVYLVSTNGSLTLPYIGEFMVDEKTVSQITSELTLRLIKYIKNPQVGVTVSAKKSLKIYFSGEFARVGAIQLEDKTNLIQGISLAGGLTPFASGRIILVRKNKSGVASRYAVKYENLLQGDPFLDQLILGRSDTIIAE